MYGLFKIVFLVLGQQPWVEKAKLNPVSFMQVWLIPAVLHHVIFVQLNKIVPIMTFMAGMAFTLALEAYIIICIMYVATNDRISFEQHYNPPKSFPVAEKLQYMKDGVARNAIKLRRRRVDQTLIYHGIESEDLDLDMGDSIDEGTSLQLPAASKPLLLDGAPFVERKLFSIHQQSSNLLGSAIRPEIGDETHSVSGSRGGEDSKLGVGLEGIQEEDLDAGSQQQNYLENYPDPRTDLTFFQNNKLKFPKNVNLDKLQNSQEKVQNPASLHADRHIERLDTFGQHVKLAQEVSFTACNENVYIKPAQLQVPINNDHGHSILNMNLFQDQKIAKYYKMASKAQTAKENIQRGVDDAQGMFDDSLMSRMPKQRIKTREDFDTIQEYIFNKIQVSDEKLLAMIEHARQEEDGNTKPENGATFPEKDGSESDGIGDNITKKINDYFEELGDANYINKQREEIMTKFKSIKEQNLKFKQFVINFKENEKLIADKLNSFKITIQVPDVNKKMFLTVDDAIEFGQQDKAKRSQSLTKVTKKLTNVNCSLPFINQRKKQKSPLNTVLENIEETNTPIQTPNATKMINQFSWSPPKQLQQHEQFNTFKFGELNIQTDLVNSLKDNIIIPAKKPTDQLSHLNLHLNMSHNQIDQFQGFNDYKNIDLEVFQDQDKTDLHNRILSKSNIVPARSKSYIQQSRRHHEEFGSGPFLQAQDALHSQRLQIPFSKTFQSEIGCSQINGLVNDEYKIPRQGSSQNRNDILKKDKCVENFKYFEKFINSIGSRHEVIFESCNDKILVSINKVQENIEQCETTRVESRTEALTRLKHVEKKLRKHVILLQELYQDLFESSKEYLQECIDYKHDFRRMLDSENKYKLAYREVQDKRSKVLDYQNEYQKTKVDFERINEEIEIKIKQLQRDSDQVFQQTIRTMAKNYGEIQSDKSSMIQISNQEKIFGNNPECSQMQILEIQQALKYNPSSSATNPFQRTMNLNSDGMVTNKIEDLDLKSLLVAFNESKQNLSELPKYIDTKVEKLKATRELLRELSVSYNEYSERLLQITEDDSTDNDTSESDEVDSSSNSSDQDPQNNLKINQKDKELAKAKSIEKRQQKKLQKQSSIEPKISLWSKLSRCTLRKRKKQDQNVVDQNMKNFIQLYKQRSQVQINDSLKILKQLISNGIDQTFLKMELVIDCDTYINKMTRLKDHLREGRKEYERRMNITTLRMDEQTQNLMDQDQKLQYVKNMKKPNRKDATKNRLTLLMQNKYLFKLQLMDDHELPEPKQLKDDLKDLLYHSKIEFKDFLLDAQNIQYKLLQIDDSTKNGLGQLENQLVGNLVSSYQFMFNRFRNLYDQIKNENMMNYQSNNSVPRRASALMPFNSLNQQNENFSFQNNDQMSSLTSFTQSDIYDQFYDCVSNSMDDFEKAQIAQMQIPSKDIQGMRIMGSSLKEEWTFVNKPQSINEVNIMDYFRESKKKHYQEVTQKQKDSADFKEGYHAGKQEIIDTLNQSLKVFWEVWKTSSAFKATVQRDLYFALNKKRPEFMSEVIVTSYEHRGTAPRLYDIKHLTPLLCEHQDSEMMADVVMQILGEIEICAETNLTFEWPYKMVIPVFVKATMKSLSTKARFHYNSIDPEKSCLQWIGKPILRLSIEPRVGLDFELKEFSPLVQSRLEEFVAEQINSFEKETIEIPMTEIPKYVQRYDIHIPVETKSVGSQANITMSDYRKEFLEKKDFKFDGIENHLNRFHRY